MNFFVGTVFGDWKTDAYVFLFPVLLAFFIASGMSYLGPQAIPSWYYLALLIAVDTPHFFSGYWVMLKENRHHALREKLLLSLVSTYALFLYLFYFGFEFFAYTFFALFSLWHFVRQHQAWFFLSLRGTPHTKSVTYWINQAGIAAVTWGFVLIGQCAEEREGWFQMNDLLLLPITLKEPLSVLTALAILAYVAHHGWLSIKYKAIALSTHLVWLSAIVVWGGTRLLDVGYLYSPLIILPHAFAYMFLLQRYERKSIRGRIIKSPLLWLAGAYLVGGLFQAQRSWPLFFDRAIEAPLWLTAFVFTISVTHYIHDMIFWRNDENPGWQKQI